jgi:peptide chain release factor subunit 1
MRVRKGWVVIDRELVKGLAGARSSTEAGFVSAFLSTSNLDHWRQTAPTFLHSTLASLLQSRPLTKEGRRQLEDDFGRLQEVLQYDVDPHVQGLALFLDGRGGVFERIELPVRLVDQVAVEQSPYVRPLVDAFSQLDPFLVVRVSRDDSSIYLVDHWRLSREEDLYGPYLKSGNRTTGDVPIKEYYAAARQESLVEQHHKEVAAALDRVVGETGVRWVVLCGQHDIAANFRAHVSQHAATLVVGEFPWDAAQSVNQMLAKARGILDEGRARRTEALAVQIQEGLGSGGRGVAGFDESMVAVHRGQVRTLLADRDYREAGWRCMGCEFAGVASTETCPVCGGAVAPVDDAVGEAMRIAILHGSFVELATPSAVLTEMGRIAGLLRYA